jgi:hypothetical protein
MRANWLMSVSAMTFAVIYPAKAHGRLKETSKLPGPRECNGSQEMDARKALAHSSSG